MHLSMLSGPPREQTGPGGNLSHPEWAWSLTVACLHGSKYLTLTMKVLLIIRAHSLSPDDAMESERKRNSVMN